MLFKITSSVNFGLFYLYFGAGIVEKVKVLLVSYCLLPGTVVAPKCWSGAEQKACFMFMFRSRRTTLTKRLVKARKRRSDETRRQIEEEGLAALLKKLKDNQLEMLLSAVESQGMQLSNCILLPRECRENEPHVLCCQTWRWPDVRQGNELRRIPACRSAADPVYICCNPYHWSRRLWQPGEYINLIL